MIYYFTRNRNLCKKCLSKTIHLMKSKSERNIYILGREKRLDINLFCKHNKNNIFLFESTYLASFLYVSLVGDVDFRLLELVDRPLLALFAEVRGFPTLPLFVHVFLFLFRIQSFHTPYRFTSR